MKILHNVHQIQKILHTHIDESVLDENGNIDQYKIDLVSRMGGNWYSRANQGLFEIQKPLKIKEIDSAANLVTVIGKEDGFEAIVKVVRVNNQSVVDGAGVINIPKSKQRKI